MGATNASAIRCIWEGVPFDKNAKHHGPAPTLAWPRIFCKESYQNGKSGFLENAQRPCKVQDIGTTLCFLSSHHNFTSFVRQSDMTIVRFCKYHQLRKLGRTTFRETSLSVVSSLKTEARESELDHVSTGKMKCQGDQLLDFYLIVSDKHISFKPFVNIFAFGPSDANMDSRIYGQKSWGHPPESFQNRHLHTHQNKAHQNIMQKQRNA